MAIELGIAMESIFLNDRDAKDGELSFSLRLRAAWLLGRNGDERKEIMNLFNRLYLYRSRAVHNGQVEANNKKDRKKEDIRKDIKDGILQLSRAIEWIILNGKWPEWPDLILGFSAK
jgi:hypothetical protein